MKKIFVLYLLIISYVILYAQTPNGSDYNAKGWQYYQDGNTIAAVACFKESANLGNAYGQYNLGICYYTGIGVAINYSTAAEWLLKSAKQGFVWAQYKLGKIYVNGNGVQKSKTESLYWYQKASNQGFALAQYQIGRYYDDVEENYAKAVEWYKKAAVGGSVWAQIQLGDHYADGTGVPKSYKNAEYWYTKAMNQENMSAVVFIGVLYEFWDEIDIFTAEGNSTAKRRLRDLYNQ
ncbi:MAG: sel1 repeat family protein [Bacteroidales bacterium]|nr:sel1 repeat family protein [Bacteroidales bacterium]